jgi:hypothetical protein
MLIFIHPKTQQQTFKQIDITGELRRHRNRLKKGGFKNLFQRSGEK